MSLVANLARDERHLAIAAEGLYLANLLLAPALAFGVLLWIYLKHYRDAPPLARCHLAQTVRATLWASILLIWVPTLILAAGGFNSPAAWTIALLHFVTVHASLVLLGIIGLARALAGQRFHFPLVGVSCVD